MAEPKAKIVTGNGYVVTFTCAEFGDHGEWLDTVVYFNGQSLCTIAGADIDKFSKSLDFLIKLYRI